MIIPVKSHQPISTGTDQRLLKHALGPQAVTSILDGTIRAQAERHLARASVRVGMWNPGVLSHDGDHKTGAGDPTRIH